MLAHAAEVARLRNRGGQREPRGASVGVRLSAPVGRIRRRVGRPFPNGTRPAGVRRHAPRFAPKVTHGCRSAAIGGRLGWRRRAQHRAERDGRVNPRLLRGAQRGADAG